MTEQPDFSDLVDAVRESGIALKPGDVLAVRLPPGTSRYQLDNARRYGEVVERETGVKVAFVIGEEFAHTTVNIHVTMHGMDAAKITEEVRRQVDAYARRHGGTRLRSRGR